jgi:hypothetical protein
VTRQAYAGSRQRRALASRAAASLVGAFALVTTMTVRAETEAAREAPPRRQSQADADAKSVGCVSCHTATDQKTMHASDSVVLGCADCHGGDATVQANGGPSSAGYEDAKQRAHVLPEDGDAWDTSANPERSYVRLLKEDLGFVRFVNPGDLRAAQFSCGGCHEDEVLNNHKSMMTHGGMLYAAALYNNGVLPGRDPIVGESYGPDGEPRMINTVPPPTAEETRDKGIVPFVVPLPRWELGQPGNVFRVFERGGRRRLEPGLPDVLEEPGKPDKGLSPRGPGTLNRTDPVIIGAQKTRLLDPMLSLLGTNDHPGDFRSSGCSACHVVYANDRSPDNSGPWAKFGNLGRTATVDPTVPKGESGHPVRHEFTRAIPSSQCISCHMHPGTNMVTTYLGYTWWDNEVDGQVMYPKTHKELSPLERDEIERANPEGAALRGNWSDPEFLANVSELNDQLENTQFGDFHGHGWVYRAVFKQDRKGNLLDAEDEIIGAKDPQKFDKAVHLKDIHLEKGMHCVDCHFAQDSHGNGKLYNEPRAAIEIACIDCHGHRDEQAKLETSGPASQGAFLEDGKTPWGEPRLERLQDGKIVQRSMLSEDLEWIVKQVYDSLDTNDRAASYHDRIHGVDKMTCDACHSSWTTSCFGCHLSQRANQHKPNLHSEGGESRNWTSYNFQTLRDDAYFLARDGHVTGSRIAPARSACAVLVSSQNQNREWIYSQQQTISSGGYSGTAFSTYIPHTVRAAEAKRCEDCHVSEANDNNAWMASLLMQGTGMMNFIGRYTYVGEGDHGFEAVVVTERDEPQAVIGSQLHEMAYPDEFAGHLAAERQLRDSRHHGGNTLSLQLRGEYLFTAEGEDGMRVYDVAQVDHKGFSEKIVSAPFSPLGQRLYVKTSYATSVALPTTQTMHPQREQAPENMEQPIHPIYSYAFVTDRDEGLVVVGRVDTLVDGDPRNNFIQRAASYNPGGALDGATAMALAGTVGYVATPRGLVVLDLNEPTQPKLLHEVGQPLRSPRAVAVQFRYAFVLDEEGLRVLDVTDVTNADMPGPPRVVEGASVPIGDARGIYLSRTYAYVAAGAEGIVIVDIERPEQPALDQTFDAGGAIDDANDIKIGATNGSIFGYVADGRNGLRVLQLISANETPGAYGFSPRPTPSLVATYHTHGHALAISRGIDRDRAVDETGHQTAVFGRRGARPFNLEEQQKLYLKAGKLNPQSEARPE